MRVTEWNTARRSCDSARAAPGDLRRGDAVADDGDMLSSSAQHERTSRRCARKTGATTTTTAFCALLAVASLPTAMAQSCISLANSRTCGAFNASSVSTNSYVTGLYPFLQNVRNVDDFDTALENYVSNAYAQLKYQTLIGCSSFLPGNTTDFYARYTTSVICNGVIQNSVSPCGLNGEAARPLCASSCADYAQSEQRIVASNICGNAGSNALTQIRADFTNCALPANALTGTCIPAVANQPNNCGFGSNLGGLCSYCASSSPNATDSCCVFSDSTSRCNGVTLPVVASASLQAFTVTTTASATTTATVSPYGAVSNTSPGLTKGQIAGIAIGSILGAFFLLFLIIAGCLLLKRRRDNSPPTSIFNQPSPGRGTPAMSYNTDGGNGGRSGGVSALSAAAGTGRVARMAALEGRSSAGSDEAYHFGGYAKSLSDDDDEFDDALERSPSHKPALNVFAPLPQRTGSLSSASQFGRGALGTGHTTAHTDPAARRSHDLSTAAGEYSSPGTTASSRVQSEQLDYFKDYYSTEDIHPGDLVATLWAYEPRAADEFPLERGDMIKVLGIWDDGWATGLRVPGQRAEDWRAEGKVLRDSGITGPGGAEETTLSSPSAASGSVGSPQSPGEGEVKAFPLVCVCLPQYWRKTIEGDAAAAAGGSGGAAAAEGVGGDAYRLE